MLDSKQKELLVNHLLQNFSEDDAKEILNKYKNKLTGKNGLRKKIAEIDKLTLVKHTSRNTSNVPHRNSIKKLKIIFKNIRWRSKECMCNLLQGIFQKYTWFIQNSIVLFTFSQETFHLVSQCFRRYGTRFS